MPWLASAATAPQQALDASIVKQLQLFGGMSRGRRLMLGVAASSLSGQEASKLMKQFLAADVDFNGTLCLEELALAAKQVRLAGSVSAEHGKYPVAEQVASCCFSKAYYCSAVSVGASLASPNHPSVW
jgi:hypothetical protein